MKKCGFLAILAIALLVVAPAATAQSATCTAVTPANSAFNAALLGNGFSGTSGSPSGFANVTFSLNGNQATVNASSLGLSNITGISLFQGQPGSSTAQLVQTFSSSSNTFNNGQFSGTMTLSPTTIAQIQSNPSNFFFVVTTPDFPNGALAGALAPSRQQLISGVLSAPLVNNAGAFMLSIGPNNGTGNVTLNFDVAANSLGTGTINSLQLLPAAGGSPLITFANNANVVNGRLTGSTQISSALAQQILQNPCAFSLGVSSSAFANGAATGALAASNEVFLPVVGSAQGVGGTNFQTDVNIFNNEAFFGSAPQSVGADVFVQFFPSGVTNSPTAISAQNVTALHIPVRGTTTLRDISTSMFNGALSGIGALRLLSSGNLAANARIYNNQIGSGKGTFGQMEPGMTRSQALQQGVLVGVGVVGTDASLANGQSFRTNIGFFNPNDTPTTIAVELRDSAGTILGQQTFSLGAWTQTQLPLTNAGGLFTNVTHDLNTASVFFLSGNPIFAYASEIDNISGDASFISPSAAIQSPNPGQ
jgi:hypothetical protein